MLPNSTALVAHSPSASPEMVPDVQLCVGSIDNATGTCSAALTPSVVGFDNISTMFTIPADSPLRVSVYRLRKGAATSAWQAINEPDTCWSIGDRGRVSNAGGSVRVSGRSLAFDRDRCLSASSVHVTDSRIRLILLHTPALVVPHTKLVLCDSKTMSGCLGEPLHCALVRLLRP